MKEDIKNEIEELIAMARPFLFPYKDMGETKMIERQLAERFINVIGLLLQENNDLKTLLRNNE